MKAQLLEVLKNATQEEVLELFMENMKLTERVKRVDVLEKENRSLQTKLTTATNKIAKLTETDNEAVPDKEPARTRPAARPAEKSTMEKAAEAMQDAEGIDTESDLANMTIPQLKEKCKELGIKGVSDFGKAKLIDVINNHEGVVDEEPVAEDEVEDVAEEPKEEVPVAKPARAARPVRGKKEEAPAEAEEVPVAKLSARPPRRSAK